MFVFLEGWQYKSLRLELDDAYIWEEFISRILTRCKTIGNRDHLPCSRNACGFNGFYIFNYQLNGINWRFTGYKNNLCESVRMAKEDLKMSRNSYRKAYLFGSLLSLKSGKTIRKEKGETHTKPLSRILRSRTLHARYLICNLSF